MAFDYVQTNFIEHPALRYNPNLTKDFYSAENSAGLIETDQKPPRYMRKPSDCRRHKVKVVRESREPEEH